MMGQAVGQQDRLFYEFDLDERVPANHLLRRIDAVLDLSWLHRELQPYYSHTGRPSIDPELMMRMLILGYVFAIRSERQLCSEVHVNLAYRWFCRLDAEAAIPDHSVFSRARHERFRDAETFRLVFEKVVDACIAAGLVGGKSFSVDASFIKADVNQFQRIPGDQPIDWPDAKQASRAVTEYLSALDQSAPDVGKGGRRSKPPKAISLTDPQAAWVPKQKMRPFFAYDANYLINNKLGIIVDAEGTRANRIEENRVPGPNLHGLHPVCCLHSLKSNQGVPTLFSLTQTFFDVTLGARRLDVERLRAPRLKNRKGSIAPGLILGWRPVVTAIIAVSRGRSRGIG